MSGAGIIAVNCVAEMKFVGRFDPFQRTTELLTKLLPLTVSVKAGPPAFAWFGVTLMTAGVGGTASLILNGAALDEPPPAPPTGWVKTVTFAVPATAMSEGVIIAVNCLDEIKVVGRSDPFHRTTELLTKFVPVTVRVKPGPPAVAEFGLIVMIVGVAGACGVIVNGSAFDEPPPRVPIGGLNTVTLADPAAEISEAGIIAVNCVPETMTVGRSTPFHCTTELKMKLEPLTVSVNPAPPAVAVFGERPANDGAGGACA